MHVDKITSVKTSDLGYIVTGCWDGTVRIWKARKNAHSGRLGWGGRRCGHGGGGSGEGGGVKWIDICVGFGFVVTGDGPGLEDGKIIVWDLKRLCYIRSLEWGGGGGVGGVCVNQQTGSIVGLVKKMLVMWDVNGTILFKSCASDGTGDCSCLVCTNCSEWMDGVNVITGHSNGDVKLWGVNYDEDCFVLMHVIPDKVHTARICCLRVVGEKGRQQDLLIGDASGKTSSASVLKLDSLSQQELWVVLSDDDDNVAVASEINSKSNNDSDEDT